ncbi:preprotein translocase subunit SecE [Methyloparacoccus murrellii]
MSAREESTSSSGLDTARLVVAILILVGGIVGFYYFADKGLVYRVLGILAASIASIALILATAMGKSFLGFLRESRVEVRKMIWPTRQETMQSTLVVVALVFLVGLLLWTLDAMLFWGVSHLTGQGK